MFKVLQSGVLSLQEDSFYELPVKNFCFRSSRSLAIFPLLIEETFSWRSFCIVLLHQNLSHD